MKDFDDFKLDYTLANTQYEIIMKQISEFEKNLDDEHEVALKLCNFGQSILLNVTDIGYHNPHLIQHINQISFLLMAVPKSNPDKPARRIAGFLADS